MNLFFVKLALMPTVMALVTLAIRRWGNKLGGLIGSMPWVAGPILLFIILEQGKVFGIQAIAGVMTGILALISFCFSYATFSKKRSWFPTLLLSYGVYTITALSFNYLKLPVSVSYPVVLLTVVLALRFFPVPTQDAIKTRRLPFDMLIRMGVATLFVVAITGLANALGPDWSGVLTPFPILTTVLAIFSHTLQGSNAAIITMRGLVMGLLGFTTFLFLQTFLLPRFPVAISFGIAFAVNAVINVVASRVW